MKQLPILHSFLKIGLLTSLIVCLSQFYFIVANGQWESVIAQNTNSQSFQSAWSSNYGSIGVALSTRIGIRLQQKSNFNSSSSQSFYREISWVGTSPSENRAIRSDMIKQNMLIIEEYLNLSRTNIKDLLKWSQNRKSTLESFISQLEMRYKSAALSITSLEKQKVLLLEHINTLETQIEQAKTNMERHFSQGEADATLEDVDDYFALRAEYTEAFTDIVFINQFLKQHIFLNNYNTWILDTLINNKEAIANQSYVVIPDSWSEYLRPLELLFDEAEIKALNQE